jgi:hypothetical protein
MIVKRLVFSVLALVVSGCVLAGSAVAVTPGAGWSIDSLARPSSFSVGDNARCSISVTECDEYVVAVTNAGSQPTQEGGTVTLTDTLPAGLTVQGIVFYDSGVGRLGINPVTNLAPLFCTTTPLVCQLPFPVAPYDRLVMEISVAVQPGAPGSFTNTVSVSGGGVPEASGSVRNTNGGVAPSFGFSGYDALIAGLDGASDTQAGDHPFGFTQTLDFNNGRQPSGGLGLSSVQDPRDIVVDLPVGFAGSALAAPQCTMAQLATLEHCPPDTTVGYIRTEPGRADEVHSPLYNMVPEHGVAAEYGFYDTVRGSHVIYASVAPTPAGYVLRAWSPEISQVALTNVVVTLYGSPAEQAGLGNAPVAQFTNPSDCSGEPQRTAIHMDSWQNPGGYNPDGTPNFNESAWVGGVSESSPVTGCDLLRFNASLGAQVETTQAVTPSGFQLELKVPQNQSPGALGTPPLRKGVVTLPAGASINPSAAGGLQTCTEAQVALGTNTQPSCPEASKIGTIEVTTPAVATVLQGSIYLASQNENPFHTLLAGYVVIDDPTTGVLIKVPGRIDPDPATGQLTVTVDEIPQFPVSDLKIHIFGGPRGPLTTPPGCGTYTTSSQLTPWSAPDSGPPATPSDSFQITSGCPGGFNPSFTAGTTNNQAGSFSPFTATFSRTDQDQNLAGVTVTTPPGLLGILKGVERCPEPQASQGTCGPNSLIGHTTVGAGSGPDPFYVQGSQDQVFLTGPYKGAPFGLSVVVPAVAGPFNLGNVVVRAAIHIDPHTAQITVVSDPLPTILQGIPLDVRTVNVTIDRPNFMFNPTSCEPLTVGGSLTSIQGASAQVSSHFQAANCQGLPFHPVFTVSTQAKTSKHNGASLTVKTTFPTGPQANIRSVGVVLPKQLPARLTTIQQACPEATFAANPASCPAGSDIGIGTAATPILSSPATGPAYLVSHGGAAFPDVDLVIQDEGVTLVLVGSVNIRHGITTSKFATVPDAPISSFQLSLPEGPHSGLAAVLPAKAKGSLCGTSLSMPFTITGQNGARLTENVKIAVTGCAKPKKKGRAKHKKGKKK